MSENGRKQILVIGDDNAGTLISALNSVSQGLVPIVKTKLPEREPIKIINTQQFVTTLSKAKTRRERRKEERDKKKFK